MRMWLIIRHAQLLHSNLQAQPLVALQLQPTWAWNKFSAPHHPV